ncbi:MAG: UvrD-helicase domain-containing protein [Clostridia bacterium]|nr:UvrD-helicase domain-containing protein [Clostridia bacterium]
MPRFNESQQRAIEAKNEKILISAAAGSGKTTVMIEKIRQTLLKNPDASIAQFLVITFTNDAAENMKEKLRQMLERDLSPEAAKALSEMETATISTIHAFCKKLMSEYNDDGNLTMSPRVLKESERAQMLTAAFDDAVEAVLGDESRYTGDERTSLHRLMAAFRQDEIRKMATALYEDLMGVPNPLSRLAEMTETLMVDRWKEEIVRSVDLDLLEVQELKRREEELLQGDMPEACVDACTKAAEQDAEITEGFLSKYKMLETIGEKLSLLKSTLAAFPKVTVRGVKDNSWYEDFKSVRNGLKGSDGPIAKGAKTLSALEDPEMDRHHEVILQELRGLGVLVREMIAQYDAQKQEKGAIDYSDMEQNAYKIISIPEKRDEILSQYRYVYVDECQDVSEIQDAIIQGLTGDGHQFFMVGDIKQSIYGFRHAAPSLFLNKRSTYEDFEDAPARRIFFMDNYRSCRNVVQAVNDVFSRCMDRRVTEMDYTEEDHLRCNREGDFGPVDVLLIQKDEDDTDQLEAQCEAVGRYIRTLVDPDGEHRWRYQDIVILVRSARTDAPRMVEYFQKMHIPVFYDGGTDFLGLSEIKAITSLLTVIDNYHHDDELVGALINAPFHFTDAELADIRLAFPERIPFWQAFENCIKRNETELDARCAGVMRQVDDWRRAAARMSVSEFVWWIIRATGTYAERGAYPDGAARQANLDVLYQKAVDAEEAGQLRLSDFVASIRDDRATKTVSSDDHASLGLNDNFVRLMTMHKSKGLEFPVVILMNLQKNLRRNAQDSVLKKSILDEGDDRPALGLYLPAIRRGQHSIMDTIGEDAFAVRALRTSIAESARLLYVAMTRAEQRLCLVGGMKEADEALWHEETDASRIWRTRSMLDMIMPSVVHALDVPAAGDTREGGIWRVTCAEARPVEDTDEMATTEREDLSQALNAKPLLPIYLPEDLFHAALKTSVTSLVRDRTEAFRQMAHHEDEEETVEVKRQPETEQMHTFRLSEVISKPMFLEEEKFSAVDVGSATHRFLRLIDLNRLRGAPLQDYETIIREEARRMLEGSIMSEEEGRMVRYRGVTGFMAGDLCQRLLKSPEVHREWGFTMTLQPGHPTLVQGIVDCAFLEGDEWILIDYKTDRDTSQAAFVARHETQMRWYREALERLSGKKVKEMWLYALRAGVAYMVDQGTPVQVPAAFGGPEAMEAAHAEGDR